MRHEKAQSSEAEQENSHRPYHCFVDRWHPDNYRSEEIQALKRAIRAKENRLVLGMPDIGLSNLLRFLVTRADWDKRQVTFAYLDCDALNDCLDRAQFFAEIVRQFYEQGLGDEPEANIESYERLRRFIRGVGGNQLDRLVVTVNKTDKLLKTADDAFYRQLKVLTDLNKRLCYIFAVSEPQASQVAAQQPLFAGRQLIVGPFNERDLAGAISEEEQRLEVKFHPTAKAQLAHLTGGHPGLLRAVTSVVVDEALDLSGPETELVARLLERDDVTGRCQRIWQVLDATQQAAVRHIAGGRPDAVTQDTLAWLRKFGLVADHHGDYKLFSPVFAGFVTAQEDIASPALVTIVAGKTFKGDEEIALRPLAQKLLAYFLEEPGRVNTYDEIAWRVWGTDEVANDMIAGLVWELRKQLGNEYIKTHHSRGYEFINPA
jgi:hypothetical protein